ncbi:unnamed protein product, partial [Vitis vinifera]|uniref:Uncharacterized protein n=1 Tax=Vitis vinifera TaxID=29760 RepID=D7TP75_VITVI
MKSFAFGLLVRTEHSSILFKGLFSFFTLHRNTVKADQCVSHCVSSNNLVAQSKSDPSTQIHSTLVILPTQISEHAPVFDKP